MQQGTFLENGQVNQLMQERIQVIFFKKERGVEEGKGGGLNVFGKIACLFM